MCHTDRGTFSDPPPMRRVPALMLVCLILLASACTTEMDNQPRKENHEPSAFFADRQSSRHLEPGTVPRGYLQDDPLLFTGREGGAPGEDGQQGATGTGQGEQTEQGTEGGEEPDQPGTGQPGEERQGGVEGEGGEQRPGGEPVLAERFPFPVTEEVLRRGQVRYNVFCAPCHSRVGDGDGMIVRRGYTRPPSLHLDRLRDAPPGHFYDVITNGWGAMPAYNTQIPAYDRWAVVAYIRALQFSQNAALEDLSAEQRQQLENGEESP